MINPGVLMPMGLGMINAGVVMMVDLVDLVVNG